jgi:hypothetical protein
MKRLYVWLLRLFARGDEYDESYRILGFELWRRPRRFRKPDDPNGES